jgi:hypothetical protein
MRVVLASAVIAALATGCDSHGQPYSRSNVEHAFRSHGFNLSAPLDLSDGPPEASSYTGVVYLPQTRERFVIVVYDHQSDADDSFQTLTLQSQATSETFNAQKGNVVVFSDEAVTVPMRKRIRAALAELD